MRNKINFDLEFLITLGSNIRFEDYVHEKKGAKSVLPTPFLLGYFAQVGEFVRRNYGSKSEQFLLYKRFNPDNLYNANESEFKAEITKILAVLTACYTVKPIKQKKSESENGIISLIKNPWFWSALAVAISLSFFIGTKYIELKFDKEKSDLLEENKDLKKINKELKNTLPFEPA